MNHTTGHPNPIQLDSAESRDYLLFGFRVRSDFPLPLASSSDFGSATIGWRIHLCSGPAPAEPDWQVIASLHDANGEPFRNARRSDEGCWMWDRSLGTCLVSADARFVHVYPREGADKQLIGLWLVGQIAVYVLHQLGCPTIHASAVMTEHGAVAFIGRWGQGKSTIAASFLRRGAKLLTDDVLPIQERDGLILVGPGLPLMKLWPESAAMALGLMDSESLPRVFPASLSEARDKRLFHLGQDFQFVVSSVPLRTLYVLDRYVPSDFEPASIVISRLRGQQAVLALMTQISVGAFLLPREVVRSVRVYARLAEQASVRCLRFPSGFANQESVCQAVLADLAAEFN